jgi:predicted ester cyclase
MTPQEMKDIFNRFAEEVINQGNVDALDKYTTPNFVENQVPPGLPPNREGSKIYFNMLRTAMPDLHVVLDDLIVEGDKLVARSTWSGTNTGEFMGVAPSGKRVSFGALDELIITDEGKATIHWGVTDLLALLQQIGAIPAPGQ